MNRASVFRELRLLAKGSHDVGLITMLLDALEGPVLTFGDLAVDDHFITWPEPGYGRGGYLDAHRLFKKTRMSLSKGDVLNGIPVEIAASGELSVSGAADIGGCNAGQMIEAAFSFKRAVIKVSLT